MGAIKLVEKYKNNSNLQNDQYVICFIDILSINQLNLVKFLVLKDLLK